MSYNSNDFLSIISGLHRDLPIYNYISNKINECVNQKVITETTKNEFLAKRFIGIRPEQYLIAERKRETNKLWGGTAIFKLYGYDFLMKLERITKRQSKGPVNYEGYLHLRKERTDKINN